MYGFVTHTWNVIKGKCPHDCEYCYMKRFPQKELHFEEKELKTDLGEGNFIFVGSSCDMFAEEVSDEWIKKVLEHCDKFSKNSYLFQTKNPQRFHKFYGLFPLNTTLGTTIETNRTGFNYKAPPVTERQYWVGELSSFPIMVTIEPIMDFDLDIMINWMKDLNPDFVNIGADSKGHNLNEPSWEKVQKLINELEEFTKVNLKPNLDRLKNKQKNDIH